MTRFEQEISGKLGDYWKASAEKELDQIREDLKAGRLTIDANGVARNRIGRALMSDMMEKLSYVTDKFSIEATRAARAEEVHASIEEYKRNYTGPSAEELAEMRAAFGPCKEIVNVITGDVIYT